MTPEWIDTSEGLERRLGQWGRSVGRVALDVEGDGMFRYRARLCTVQLASSEAICVVDTLAADPRGALAQLLGADGPVKVLHDAAFDARLLRDAGVELARVFDTAIAARFLGEPATGLAALAKKFLDVDIPKELQLSDWGKRPLGDEAVAYLADDVRHLLALADHLEAEVARRGIEAEVAEECGYVLRQAGLVPEERPAWARVKGWEGLPPVGQSVLRELILLREHAAERQDVPPFKVARNEALLAIAQRPPEGRRDLRRIGGLLRGRARELLEGVLRATEVGVARGQLPDEELARVRPAAPPPEERARRKARERALSAWRLAAAKERGVDLQVVLPGHCLKDVVAADVRTLEELTEVDGLGDVRLTRDGPAIVEVLRKLEEC